MLKNCRLKLNYIIGFLYFLNYSICIHLCLSVLSVSNYHPQNSNHMELVNPLVEQYAQQFTTPMNEIIHRIHVQSEQHSQAHMLSSEVQGSWLAFISQIIRPKYILEIGTFTGYSALCLCTGLQPGGELHTI